MTALKTDERLLSALRDAARRELTAEKVERQRISFIMGTIKPGREITRADVQNILYKHEGSKEN